MCAFDTVVIGGGQSGLATAYRLREAGLRPLILEAGPAAVGSWPHYYDSLRLFSPARYSALPGRVFDGDPDRYPHRDEVTAYLSAYAEALDVDIRTDSRVERVTTDGPEFLVHLENGTVLTAPSVVAATGGFGHPYRPTLPGLESFSGTVLHASQYRNPQPYAGRRIVVVGAGNSAVQIAVELADTATVTLASRAPVTFLPQRPFGRDLHYWFTVTGFDFAPLGRWVEAPTQPVIDDRHYRAAVVAGKPDRREMFTRIDGSSVIWPDGSREHVDVLLLATGYRPDLGYLADLGALDSDGNPRHRAGLSTTHPSLAYVGVEWQRTPASASLRGVGRDAKHIAARFGQQVIRGARA
ncbi:flavin-containing monooxygenase [Fodinicola feengrottensis]